MMRTQLTYDDQFRTAPSWWDDGGGYPVRIPYHMADDIARYLLYLHELLTVIDDPSDEQRARYRDVLRNCLACWLLASRECEAALNAFDMVHEALGYTYAQAADDRGAAS